MTFGTPRTPGHGGWVQLGNHAAEATMVILQGDPENRFIGAFRVRFRVRVLFARARSLREETAAESGPEAEEFGREKAVVEAAKAPAEGAFRKDTLRYCACCRPTDLDHCQPRTTE